MKLRPYQERAINKFLGSRRKSVLLVAPTGAGKGTMATHLMSTYARRGKRVLFLVHRREIVHDIIRRLAAKGIACAQTLYSDRMVRVISVQRALRAKILPVDLIVIDEAHHYAADEWKAVMERIKTDRIVGFTATPQRSDGKPLGDMFEEIIDVVSYSQLLELKHLTPCRVLRPFASIEKDQIALEPGEAYLKYGRGERALIFVRRVKEAEQVAACLRVRGVRAKAIHGKTPKVLRDETLLKLEQGELDVVVNVGILTEGVDMPHVTCLVLARPCAHASTYVQIVGRVLRVAPGKRVATVIDLVGASFAHGLPNQDRLYSLEGAGMVQREREDSRSGPSGPHKPAQDLDVLDMDLVEIKPSALWDAAPLPAQSPRGPVPKLSPDELTACRRKRALDRQRQHQGQREAIRKLGTTEPRGRIIGAHFRTAHGTSLGFIFQDRDFWNAMWREDGKKRRLGLCTKDKATAEELLNVLREEGPEALRQAVLKRKRSAMSLFQSRASSLWSLRRWNDDRTGMVTVRLSTRSLEEAKRVRELFTAGQDTKAYELIQRFRDRNDLHASKLRSDKAKLAYARRQSGA